MYGSTADARNTKKQFVLLAKGTAKNSRNNRYRKSGDQCAAENRKRKNNDTEKRQRDKENTKMENRKDVMYTDMARKTTEKTEATKETEKAREQEEKNMNQNKTQNPDNGEMTRRELKSRRTGSTKTFE